MSQLHLYMGLFESFIGPITHHRTNYEALALAGSPFRDISRIISVVRIQPLRTILRMLPRNDPDRIRIAFDDHRLVANGGLILFVIDREGDTLDLEADHRRHAEIENAIRDLKYGLGLNRLPSGRFPANAAWLAVQIIAHNLARWTTRIGLGEPVATAKTFRRRFCSLAGRLTPHLPKGWPWRNQFNYARARLRALPLAS